MSAVAEAYDLRELAVRLVAISELLDRRSEQATARVDAAADRLERAAQAATGQAERVAREMLDTVRMQGAATLQAGLGDALARCRTAIDDAGAQAHRAAADWSTQRTRLAAGPLRLLWAGSVALLVGSLLAVAGSAWVVRQHRRELAQAGFARELLAATRRGAIARCGVRLCARVDTGRRGAHPEYRPVAD